MTFFVTSVGKGDGANLGGIEGADAHCQTLAQAAGPACSSLAGRAWRAYLSAVAADGSRFTLAIGLVSGPWHNQKGALMAATVADLHGDITRDRNQMNKLNALTEKGQPVMAWVTRRTRTTFLTGSDSFGRAVPGTADSNCNNWKSNAATGPARCSGIPIAPAAGTRRGTQRHPSRGCGQANLVATGGAGLFYCFAAN